MEISCASNAAKTAKTVEIDDECIMFVHNYLASKLGLKKEVLITRTTRPYTSLDFSLKYLKGVFEKNSTVDYDSLIQWMQYESLTHLKGCCDIYNGTSRDINRNIIAGYLAYVGS